MASPRGLAHSLGTQPRGRARTRVSWEGGVVAKVELELTVRVLEADAPTTAAASRPAGMEAAEGA